MPTADDQGILCIGKFRKGYFMICFWYLWENKNKNQGGLCNAGSFPQHAVLENNFWLNVVFYPSLF